VWFGECRVLSKRMYLQSCSSTKTREDSHAGSYNVYSTQNILLRPRGPETCDTISLRRFQDAEHATGRHGRLQDGHSVPLGRDGRIWAHEVVRRIDELLRRSFFQSCELACNRRSTASVACCGASALASRRRVPQPIPIAPTPYVYSCARMIPGM